MLWSGMYHIKNSKMDILRNIILIPELLFLVYFGFSALYFFVFAVASHFYKETNTGPINKKLKGVIFIPSYKEDNVILETAQSAVKHLSKHSLVDVVVIADSIKPETINQIKNAGVTVVTVAFNNSTKAKSIKKALEVTSENYNYVVVLDADNIIETGFIDKLIDKLEQGYQVVQGHRTAKNSNTNFAVLDGISEEVNNSIFREGHSVLGLSASLIGSGFACRFELFKELMQNAEAVGGFDKELELMLIGRKIRIGYAKSAIVYDEKIQQPDAFVKQRRRWLSAQFIYFKKNIYNGFVQLFNHGNIDYFDKLIQFMVPPRIILLGFTYAITVLYLSFFLILGTLKPDILFLIWSGISVLGSLSIILAIPSNKFGASLLRSVFALPGGFLLTLVALFRVKGANKKFIHTTHGINNKTEIK